MPGIGNLFVRLGVEAQDFNRGMDRAQREVKNLENSSDKLGGSFKRLASAFAVGDIAANVITATLGKLRSAFSDIVMDAAKYEMLGVSMKVVGNIAGYTGDQMEDAAIKMQKLGISMSESRNATIQLVTAGLKLSEAEKYASVARDAAVVGLTNTTDAMMSIIRAVKSGEVEILKTLGINVSFEQSYRVLEKTLDKHKGTLNEVEKTQARANAVFTDGASRLGVYEAAMGTAGKQVMSLERHFDNLKVLIGTAFTPALAEIIETITGAVTGLNGELSGESKRAIAEWGVSFRITIIGIEAEIMRLAMFLDKIGGTLTSAQMLLTGPGAALGIESSKKRFEEAAKANIEYEERYKATEKALESLAMKQINLEASLTDAGKSAAKAVADAEEKKQIAAALAAKKLSEKKDLSEAELKAAAKLYEQMLSEDVKAAERKDGLWKDSEKAYKDYNDAIFEATAGEYQKDMKAADEWLQKQRDRLNDAAISYNEYQAQLAASEAATDEMRGIAYHEEQMRQVDDATRIWKEGEDKKETIINASLDRMKASFADFLTKAFTGELESFKDYWTAFWKSMAQIAANSLSEDLFEWIKKELKGGVGTSGGGVSGLVSSGISAIGSMFGFGGGGGGTSYLDLGATTGWSGLSFASGGTISEPSWLVSQRTGMPWGQVAEAGPENISPAGNGGTTIVVYNHVVATDSQSMEDALRRNPNAVTSLVINNLKQGGLVRSAIMEALS